MSSRVAQPDAARDVGARLGAAGPYGTVSARDEWHGDLDIRLWRRQMVTVCARGRGEVRGMMRLFYASDHERSVPDERHIARLRIRCVPDLQDAPRSGGRCAAHRLLNREEGRRGVAARLARRRGGADGRLLTKKTNRAVSRSRPASSLIRMTFVNTDIIKEGVRPSPLPVSWGYSSSRSLRCRPSFTRMMVFEYHDAGGGISQNRYLPLSSLVNDDVELQP